MTRLLAVAGLRLRECLAARLAWLVVAMFAVGVGAALWAQGPDAAARAAKADRVALWTAWGLALVVAAVVPSLGLPSDVKSGAAQSLFAAPASRFQIVAGGVIGYGAFATMLLVAMSSAALLGMQAAGVGAAQRDALRPAVATQIVDAAADGTFVLDRAHPAASFRFRVPEGLGSDDLRVRFAPQPVVETGLDQQTTALVSVHRPGAPEGRGRRVAFKSVTHLTARLAVGDLRAGDEAEVTLRRETGRWKFVFRPGDVEVGGARRLFSLGVIEAALCLAPLLVLLAAAASLGAARFGTPTAIVFAAFLFLAFVGRGTIVDGARFVVEQAQDPRSAGEVSGARVALARGALAVCDVLPRLDAFDRTDALVERRAPTGEDLGRAAAQGLPAAVLATALAWLLLRRRELPAS